MYTGSSVDTLTRIPGQGCDDGTIHFEAVAGTTYHIVEQAELGEAIDFELTLRALDRPANDDFADATWSAVRCHGRSTTICSRGRSSPTNPRASLPFRLTTVWYAWTAPTTGPMTIETCGSEITTHIGVFTGAAVDALTTRSSENHCGLNGTATFQATGGTTYRGADRSHLVPPRPDPRHVPRPSDPANDTFTGARRLVGADPIVVHDSNLDATREAGEPLHAGEGGGSSLWYRWTAPTTGEYRIDTCDSGVFGTQLGIYTSFTASMPSPPLPPTATTARRTGTARSRSSPPRARRTCSPSTPRKASRAPSNSTSVAHGEHRTTTSSTRWS